MPTPNVNSFTQLLRSHMERTEAKLEEICERLERDEKRGANIERELIGEIGDEESQQVSIKAQLTELQNHRRAAKGRDRFWKMVASGSLVAAFGFLIERLFHIQIPKP